MNALRRRILDRAAIVRAHLAMLEEEAERQGGGIDHVQLDFLYSEMVFLADLSRTMYLAGVRAGTTERTS